MIAKLTGILDTISESSLILDVGGVGYLVFASARTLSQLKGLGESQTLYIDTVVREESFNLYGFGTVEEQSCFRLLTTVQGVGNKMALSLLSSLSPGEIYHGIQAQDKALLQKAEGVGPRLASRMVTELKGKVPEGQPLAVCVGMPALGPHFEEAISALINLGYRRQDVVTALGKLDPQLALGDLVRQGLTLLTRTVA